MEGECDSSVQQLIDRLTHTTVPPHTQEHEEGEKETGKGEGDDDKQSSDGDSWMDDLTLAKRSEIINKDKKKPTSGIEKAKTWVGSSDFMVTAAPSST